jgi:LPXTG-motif cell wall-anchored protein
MVDPEPVVLDQSVESSPVEPVRATTLPRTGSSTIALLALGLAMSLAGAVLLVAGERREAS